MPRPLGVPDKAVPLTRGRPPRYDAKRMAFLFTMMHGANIVDCEISSSALDDLDHTKGTLPGERQAQFMRLRETVERVASVAFEQGKRKGEPVRIFSKQSRRCDDRWNAAAFLKPPAFRRTRPSRGR
ncbi:Protein of unknown function [Bradyrhizobium arachidis]|nr:Protein of unknown function [Bradyrhizobium arachidis]